MSHQSSISPSEQFDELDTSALPQGSCSYILLLPEIKGERCGCVNFTLKRSRPGATCECGHLACFHHKAPEPAVDRAEMEALRQRVQQLEATFRLDEEKGKKVLARVSRLEGAVEAKSEEMGQEIRRTYGNLSRAWHSIGELEQRSSRVDQGLLAFGAHLKSFGAEMERVKQRQAELDDADLSLEERVMDLEEQDTARDTEPGLLMRSRRRKSMSEALPSAEHPASDSTTCPSLKRRRSSASMISPEGTRTTPMQVFPLRRSELWTVHVSLLPTASQPFPFERHTNAYQRCLSRGLHQMVAVKSMTMEALNKAISEAFKTILQCHSWAPLQVKLCDGNDLQGLPMLRPLDQTQPLSMDLLRANCAVLDNHGHIEAMYIAMEPEKSLSWHAIRRLPIHMPGLEASWAFDPLLDCTSPFTDDEEGKREASPSAGDLVGAVLPNLKRGASQISRAGSFGAATGVAAEISMTNTASDTKAVANAATKATDTAATLTTVASVAAAAAADVDRPRPLKVARLPCKVVTGCEAASRSIETI